VKNGLDGVGPDLVHALSYLEFGLPQELRIGLGNEQAVDLQQFLTGARHHQISQALSFRFLFRRKLKNTGHRGYLREKRQGIFKVKEQLALRYENSTHFPAAYPGLEKFKKSALVLPL
jgi:hypothetical protein